MDQNLHASVYVGKAMSEEIGGFTCLGPMSGMESVESAESRLWRIFSRRRFVACVQALDFVTFSVTFLVWLGLETRRTHGYSTTLYFLVAILTATSAHCVFRCFRLYDFAVLMGGSQSIARVVCAGAVALAPVIIVELARPNIEGGEEFVSLVAVPTLLFVTTLRFVIPKLMSMLIRAGALQRRIYVVADSAAAASALIAQLGRTPDDRVVGTKILSSESIPAEQDMESVLRYVRTHPVELLLVKLPLSNPGRLAEIAQVLQGLPRKALLVPYVDGGDELGLGRYSSIYPAADVLDDIPVVALSERPLTGWSWVIKDLQDRALAIVLLILVAPVMVSISLAIKLSDPGPVLFEQTRFGYGRTVFKILKFRTMRVNPEVTDPTVFRLTARDDPRITPVGRFLRKTSMDELPQLWNVIRGDMWIIGPRPHSPYATAAGQIYGSAIREYAARYRIKPGITGWAQVCGWRGPTETLEQLQNRVRHDLYYIEHWSPLLDMRILYKTLFCAFGDKNAF